MEFKKWFKKPDEIPPQYELDEAQRFYPALVDLKSSQGWQIISGFLVEEVNKTIAKWMAGVDDRTQLRLGSRIEALGWVLDLVDNKIQLYSIMLKHIEEESSEDRDGTTPFLDPHEDMGD